MKQTLMISLLVGSLALAGCASWRSSGSSAGAAAAPGGQSFDALAARAEEEIKLANKTGFLWTNTEKFLADAKEAQKAGDTDKAMTLAKKALDEAVLAQQQAKANANPQAKFTP